ncbi:hypothetical protein DFJ74DRAFT_711644 [Hyaloraphidium curvatum]|nr:hypothetical protein DFJ74DRAFT_711644 [Hyaloraphidium curvatum]
MEGTAAMDRLSYGIAFLIFIAVVGAVLLVVLTTADEAPAAPPRPGKTAPAAPVGAVRRGRVSWGARAWELLSAWLPRAPPAPAQPPSAQPRDAPRGHARRASGTARPPPDPGGPSAAAKHAPPALPGTPHGPHGLSLQNADSDPNGFAGSIGLHRQPGRAPNAARPPPHPAASPAPLPPGDPPQTLVAKTAALAAHAHQPAADDDGAWERAEGRRSRHRKTDSAASLATATAPAAPQISAPPAPATPTALPTATPTAPADAPGLRPPAQAQAPPRPPPGNPADAAPAQAAELQQGTWTAALGRRTSGRRGRTGDGPDAPGSDDPRARPKSPVGPLKTANLAQALHAKQGNGTLADAGNMLTPPATPPSRAPTVPRARQEGEHQREQSQREQRDREREPKDRERGGEKERGGDRQEKKRGKAGKGGAGSSVGTVADVPQASQGTRPSQPGTPEPVSPSKRGSGNTGYVRPPRFSPNKSASFATDGKPAGPRQPVPFEVVPVATRSTSPLPAPTKKPLRPPPGLSLKPAAGGDAFPGLPTPPPFSASTSARTTPPPSPSASTPGTSSPVQSSTRSGSALSADAGSPRAPDALGDLARYTLWPADPIPDDAPAARLIESAMPPRARGPARRASVGGHPNGLGGERWYSPFDGGLSLTPQVRPPSQAEWSAPAASGDLWGSSLGLRAAGAGRIGRGPAAQEGYGGWSPTSPSAPAHLIGHGFLAGLDRISGTLPPAPPAGQPQQDEGFTYQIAGHKRAVQVGGDLHYRATAVAAAAAAAGAPEVAGWERKEG